MSHEQADDGVGHVTDLIGFVSSMLEFHELLGNAGGAARCDRTLKVCLNMLLFVHKVKHSLFRRTTHNKSALALRCILIVFAKESPTRDKSWRDCSLQNNH